MDENTTMNEQDLAMLDEEDEVFDMSMATQAAAEMFEQQHMEEMSQFKEIEGFAAIFPDNWVVEPPSDPAKRNPIISKQLAKKARRA